MRIVTVYVLYDKNVFCVLFLLNLFKNDVFYECVGLLIKGLFLAIRHIRIKIRMFECMSDADV